MKKRRVATIKKVTKKKLNNEEYASTLSTLSAVEQIIIIESTL